MRAPADDRSSRLLAVACRVGAAGGTGLAPADRRARTPARRRPPRCEPAPRRRAPHARRRRLRVHPRRRRLHGRRPPLHGRGQVPRRSARHVHVPVLPGHTRREGRDPRARPHPPGGRELAARSRPSTPPKSSRPSTCAWPARPAPPTAPPASTWPATAPKHSSAPTGDACAPSATTRSAGCRASPASPRACPAWRRIANAVMSVAPLRSLAFRIIGLDPRRGMPALQSGTFTAWARRRNLLAGSVPAGDSAIPFWTSITFRRFQSRCCASIALPQAHERDAATARPARERGGTPASSDSAREREAATASSMAGSPILSGPRDPGGRPYALVWADSFSQTLDDTGARAVVDVLEANGFAPIVAPDACCGLTWITTGSADGREEALGVVARRARALRGVRGSRSSASSPRARRCCATTCWTCCPRIRARRSCRARRDTLAEVLSAVPASVAPPAEPGGRRDRRAAALPPLLRHGVGHGPGAARVAGCARHAARRAAAAWPGISAWRRATTTCRSRSPRIRCCRPCRRSPDAVYLADGFSCRTQAAQLAGRGGVHLATLLAGRSA